MAVPTESGPTLIPSRSGTSQIGTSSPNSGAAGNTNSSYAVGAFTSGVNQESGTSYTVQNTDYGGYIVFNTSSAITITLNQAVGTNFTTTIVNIGTGAITLTPNGSLLVNGSSSLTLGANQGVQVFFANRAWQAYAGTTILQVVPVNTPAVTHEWLASYNATTGAFTQTQPAFSDITGQITTAQLPSSGISVTITTAKLTVGGTQGSMVFTNGILTSQVAAT